jgi:hypothetical protein
MYLNRREKTHNRILLRPHITIVFKTWIRVVSRGLKKKVVKEKSKKRKEIGSKKVKKKYH